MRIRGEQILTGCLINISKLKLVIRAKFPSQSLVRRLILSEPDELSRDEAIEKFGLWDELMCKELA